MKKQLFIGAAALVAMAMTGCQKTGTIEGVVTDVIFKGVHYEMCVMSNGFEWIVHSTDCFPVDTHVGIHVDPFDIQIMHKPESEDEKAVAVDE